MLRALFIHRDLLFHGGVPRCFLSYSQNLDPRRMDMHVASFVPPAPEMLAAFQPLSHPPLTLSDKGYLKPARQLRKYLKQNQIQIVVANSFKSYVVSKLAAARLHIPVIFWIHAIKAMLIGNLRKKLLDRLVRHDTIISVSQAVQKAHRPLSHLGPLHVIYNGLSDPLATPLAQPYPRSHLATLSLPPDAIVLTCTAEFIDWKDHPTLLTAFNNLADQNPRLHLLLLGKGETESHLRALAHPRVHFLGVRTDARRLLGVTDIYVHPARGEGFGLAIAEAMLAAKPVIVSDEGAQIEFIEDHKTGLIFQAGNAADLTSKIQSLLDNPSLAHDLGASARTHALSQFSIANWVNQITHVLETTAKVPTPLPAPNAQPQPQTPVHA